jgi:putative spermidine/putrescine transport system ATP-binding protein
LFPHFTVAENVAFPLKVRHVSRAEQKRRVAHALDLVELRGYEDRKPHQISGGQQQRVALARALVFEPDMLLLDEPLSALDKKLRSSLQTELRELQRRIEKTFLCVTHDQEEALSMSDEIAILRSGKLIQIGAPQVLFERPYSYFVADFLGESNFIEGRVVGYRENAVEYAVGQLTFSQATAGNPKTDKILLALRPARIGLSRREPTDANRLKGTVASCQYRGNEVQCTVETSLGRLSVLQPTWGAESAPSAGEAIWLHWNNDAAQIVTDDRLA